MGSRSYADADFAKRLLNPVTGPSKFRPITVFERRIRYHWPFAIPAFIVILAFLITIASAIAVCWTNRFGLGSLRAALHKTSIGRVLGELLYPEVSLLNSNTSAWVHNVGKLEVDFSNHCPTRGKGVETSSQVETSQIELLQLETSQPEASQPLMQDSAAPGTNSDAERPQPETSRPLMQQNSAIPVIEFDAERLQAENSQPLMQQDSAAFVIDFDAERSQLKTS